MQRPHKGADASSGKAQRAQHFRLRGASASQAAQRLNAPCPRAPHNRQCEGSNAVRAPSTKRPAFKLTDISPAHETLRSL
jgi:hypothetical protein